MTMAMPSPSLRNRERLYLTGAVGRVLGAAYDALPRRRARDAEEDDGGIAEVKAYIQANMDPRAYAKLEAMLEQLAGGGGGGSGERELDRRRNDPQYNANGEGQGREDFGANRNGGRDEPPAFRGRPRPGGMMDEETDVLPGTEPNIPRRNVRQTEGGGSPGKDGRRRFAGAHDEASLDDYHKAFGVNYSTPSSERSFSDEWRDRQLRRR